MNRKRKAPYINPLSASEGIFTTAQAARCGISRDSLAKACAAGNLVRLTRGAYRSAAVASTPWDEIAATWKLTAPAKMLHERMNRDAWDGITIGGTTAASLNGLGDFYLYPIRMYAHKRIKIGNPDVRTSIRIITWEDVDLRNGFATTKPERTLVDLALDNEELSLIRNACGDALERGLDLMALRRVIETLAPNKEKKVLRTFREVGIDSI